MKKISDDCWSILLTGVMLTLDLDTSRGTMRGVKQTLDLVQLVNCLNCALPLAAVQKAHCLGTLGSTDTREFERKKGKKAWISPTITES